LYVLRGKPIAFWPGLLIGPQVLSAKTNWLLGLKKNKEKEQAGKQQGY
jgi:hypothetical protein